MDWNETKAFLSTCFPESVQAELAQLYPGELQEIRIRAQQPTLLCTMNRTVSVPWRPEQLQVETLAEALTEYSLYARGDETRQGFVTLRGGHRLGLCGHLAGRPGCRSIREIGSLCLRIAGQWPGAADVLIPRCRQGSMLLIGPPGSGKTTLLRDITRQLASGSEARQVAVIDERGELAACVRGVPQLDIGESADVLDGCPKGQAVSWLIRSMAPQVIVTDELAGDDDVAAILEATACGAQVMASAHGAGLNELAARPAMAALMARRVFRHYAVLSPEGGGRIAALYDRSGSPVS